MISPIADGIDPNQKFLKKLDSVVGDINMLTLRLMITLATITDSTVTIATISHN